jgi:hypothetical protein
MWKKLLVAAVLVAPSAAFAADIVIRFEGPGRVSHPHSQYHNAYYGHPNHGWSHSEQRMSQQINQEQANQRERVAQGIRSGELTRAEAAALSREQASIRALEGRYLADRNLTRGEYERLQQELREANRHIYAQKNDREDRDRHYRYSYNRW